MDDVEGGTDAPGSGTLALLSVEQAEALWEAIEFTPDDQELPTVGGLVDAQVVEPATLVDVRDGDFHAEVDDGDYLVCLLDGTGPYALRGCAQATVEGPATWQISRGEGGVDLSTS